ncbi:transglycosylase domain-containing protein [Flexivirga meconopsidis]|uniref:transglycosylase domain-containing protein n=1 Tax=Flexivirga meconopsidis TaxID=2977121 RepID=UPI00223FBE54|nr:transglycosylase domain-containing protein [Flexivirga meconopsidis]
MRQVNRFGTVFSLLGALIATAIAMGLVAAGLALPAIGAAGQATNGSIKLFNQIPSNIDMNPLAQQSRILAADGSVLATPFNQNRIVVPFDKISQNMKNAQVAIEDERFYQHGAIDSKGLLRAITSNVFSNGTQGASTLTQQYVKVMQQNQAINTGNEEAANRAVTQSGMEGYVRKLQQLKYAVTIEQKYTKDQILDGYLNLVYYGGQAYGVEAAARHYFGISAAELNLPQSAMLAGVVNEPGRLDPTTNPDEVLARRNVVLDKMYQQKMISYTQLVDAKKAPLGLKLTQVNSNSCANSKYAYFCYYVINWLQTQPALGKDPKSRLATLQSGGLTIKTSFDPKMADAIDKEIRKKVPQGNSEGIDSAGIIIQPGTGLVLASGQNTQYSNVAGPGKNAQNFTTDGEGYAYGSTAKMFTVVNALEAGWSPEKKMTVPSYNTTSSAGAPAHAFSSADFPGKCGLTPGTTWKLPNDAPYPPAGQKMSLKDATAQSVNTVFAEMVSQLGSCDVLKTTSKFGVESGTGQQIQSTAASITLGTSDVTPLDLTNAYATIAAGGKYCPPRPVVSISDSNGKKLPLSGTECKQLVSEKVAAETSEIFQSVITDPAGTTHGDILLNGNRPAAGKTGTEDGAKNIWFVGYTPQLATGIWVGHNKAPAPMKDITLAGQKYDGYVFAGDLAAPIWKNVMDAALKGKPIEYFQKPDGTTPKSKPAPKATASTPPPPTPVGPTGTYSPRTYSPRTTQPPVVPQATATRRTQAATPRVTVPRTVKPKATNKPKATSKPKATNRSKPTSTAKATTKPKPSGK